MSAFGFKFWKKKSANSPKKGKDIASDNSRETPLKEPLGSILEPDPKENRMADKMKDIVKKSPPPLDGSRKKSLLKPIFFTLLIIVFAGALLFILGPKHAPELMEKIGATKIIEKIPFLNRETEEELMIPEEEVVEELVTVRTYRAIRGDFVDILPGMGTIRGDREVELRFSVNGIVDSINFFEGDLLRKGDIVATLDQKDALLKLEYSKSKHKAQQVAGEAAKKRLEIHQTLYDDGIIIKPKLEEVGFEYKSVETQIKSSQKEVEFALAELDKTYLYSPIDSVMGTRDAEVGEFVTSNVKIASLYETATVIAEMGVIEKDINRVALGQKAKVTVDTYPGVEFEGQIENIAPIIEGKSRTLTIKIRIKNNNPRGTLLPGMFARIWISVYEKKNTIKLPSSCFYDMDNNGEFDAVFIVTDENIAHVAQVKIGYVSTDYVEVTDGLREGDQAVSESMAELKDGVKVDVIEVQEAIF